MNPEYSNGRSDTDQHSSAGSEGVVEKAVSENLDRSIVDLPETVVSGLAQARKHAMKAQADRSSSGHWPWMSAVAFSFAVVVAWPLISDYSSKDEQALSPEPTLNEAGVGEDAFSDLMLLAEMDSDSMAVIEDIEFALWLSQELSREAESDRDFEDNTGASISAGSHDLNG